MSDFNFSIDFTARLLASESCAVGDVLVFDSAAGVWKVATLANRTAIGSRGQAIALTAYGGSAVGKVSFQTGAILAQSISGLPDITPSLRKLVRIDDDGRLERIDLVSLGDDVVGLAESDGRVHLSFGFPWEQLPSGGGGGGTPGFPDFGVQFRQPGGTFGGSNFVGISTDQHLELRQIALEAVSDTGLIRIGEDVSDILTAKIAAGGHKTLMAVDTVSGGVVFGSDGAFNNASTATIVAAEGGILTRVGPDFYTRWESGSQYSLVPQLGYFAPWSVHGAADIPALGAVSVSASDYSRTYIRLIGFGAGVYAFPAPGPNQSYQKRIRNVGGGGNKTITIGAGTDVILSADEEQDLLFSIDGVSKSTSAGGGGGTPSLPSRSVQFYEAGAFGGADNVTISADDRLEVKNGAGAIATTGAIRGDNDFSIVVTNGGTNRFALYRLNSADNLVIGGTQSNPAAAHAQTIGTSLQSTRLEVQHPINAGVIQSVAGAFGTAGSSPFVAVGGYLHPNAILGGQPQAGVNHFGGGAGYTLVPDRVTPAVGNPTGGAWLYTNPANRHPIWQLPDGSSFDLTTGAIAVPPPFLGLLYNNGGAVGSAARATISVLSGKLSLNAAGESTATSGLINVGVQPGAVLTCLDTDASTARPIVNVSNTSFTFGNLDDGRSTLIEGTGGTWRANGNFANVKGLGFAVGVGAAGVETDTFTVDTSRIASRLPRQGLGTAWGGSEGDTQVPEAPPHVLSSVQYIFQIIRFTNAGSGTYTFPSPTAAQSYTKCLQETGGTNKTITTGVGTSFVLTANTARICKFTNLGVFPAETITGGGGGGTPSAPLTSIQYNNAGTFGGAVHAGISATGRVKLQTAAEAVADTGLINVGVNPGSIMECLDGIDLVTPRTLIALTDTELTIGDIDDPRAVYIKSDGGAAFFNAGLPQWTIDAAFQRSRQPRIGLESPYACDGMSQEVEIPPHVVTDTVFQTKGVQFTHPSAGTYTFPDPGSADFNYFKVCWNNSATSKTVSIGSGTTYTLAPNSRRSLMFDPNGVFACDTTVSLAGDLETSSPLRLDTVDMSAPGGTVVASVAQVVTPFWRIVSPGVGATTYELPAQLGAFFFVYNPTAFAHTFKVTAQTGCVVAATSSAWIYCTGTDYRLEGTA